MYVQKCEENEKNKFEIGGCATVQYKSISLGLGLYSRRRVSSFK